MRKSGFPKDGHRQLSSILGLSGASHLCNPVFFSRSAISEAQISTQDLSYRHASVASVQFVEDSRLMEHLNKAGADCGLRGSLRTFSVTFSSQCSAVCHSHRLAAPQGCRRQDGHLNCSGSAKTVRIDEKREAGEVGDKQEETTKEKEASCCIRHKCGFQKPKNGRSGLRQELPKTLQNVTISFRRCSADISWEMRSGESIVHPFVVVSWKTVRRALTRLFFNWSHNDKLKDMQRSRSLSAAPTSCTRSGSLRQFRTVLWRRITTWV